MKRSINKTNTNEEKRQELLVKKGQKPALISDFLCLFPLSIYEIAALTRSGREKRDQCEYVQPYDLKDPQTYATVSEAMVRHLMGELIHGPINSSDGPGTLHPAQLVWNALIRLECFLTIQKKDENDEKR